MNKYEIGAVLGAFLIIIGVFLYITGDSIINEVDDYNILGLPISGFLKQVSSDINNYYTMGLILIIGGFIITVIGIALIIIGIVTPYIKSEVKSPKLNDVKKVSTQDEAISILRTRYAEGEITKEEFIKMKKNLRE